MPTATDTLDFSGTWICRYWYPNTKRDSREETSEYHVRIEPHNGGYTLQSLTGQGEAEGSHMEARFTVDGTVVTGTFMENSSPKGDWVGMTYKGAFQLLLSDDRHKMEGKWVAAGFNNGDPKAFTGRWEIVRESAA